MTSCQCPGRGKESEMLRCVGLSTGPLSEAKSSCQKSITFPPLQTQWLSCCQFWFHLTTALPEPSLTHLRVHKVKTGLCRGAVGWSSTLVIVLIPWCKLPHGAPDWGQIYFSSLSVVTFSPSFSLMVSCSSLVQVCSLSTFDTLWSHLVVQRLDQNTRLIDWLIDRLIMAHDHTASLWEPVDQIRVSLSDVQIHLALLYNLLFCVSG